MNERQVVQVDERVGDLLRDAHALLPHESRLIIIIISSGRCC